MSDLGKRSWSVARRRLTWLGVLATGAMVLAACSGISPKLAESTTTTSSTTTTTVPKATKATTTPVDLFFGRGQSLGVASTSVAVKSVRFDTMQALFAGPSANAKAAGLSSAIPPAAKLEGLSFSGPLAYVDLNTQFFTGAPTTASFRLRVAQIVYTLTQFTGLTEVQLYLHGASLPNIDALPTSRPMTRSDLSGAINGVLIISPAVGATVGNPIAISGISAVSGTLEVQLVGSNGQLIVSTVATTVVGESFTYSYPFTSQSLGAATVRILVAAGRSDTSQLIASIPVTLTG